MIWWTGAIVWRLVGFAVAIMLLATLVRLICTTIVWARIVRRTKGNWAFAACKRRARVNLYLAHRLSR